MNIKRRNRLLLLLLAAIAVFALTQALAEGGQEVAETAESAATAANPYINSFWALVPAIIAIALALLTGSFTVERSQNCRKALWGFIFLQKFL